MKFTKLILLPLIGLLLLISACTQAQDDEPNGQQDGQLKNKTVLTVYLSRTNNTKALAEIIHAKVGGDLVGLELVTPYPSNYQANVDQVVRENGNNFLPPLKTKIENIEKYDVVFIGFPIWDMQVPPPIKSFLNQYDLSGKTIVPFDSNGGYGPGNSFQTIKRLCPNSTVLDGYSTTGGKEKEGILFVMEGNKQKQVESEVDNWLRKLNLTK